MASAAHTAGRVERRALTPAQMYCLAAGATLLLAGILGFIADSSFDTGNAVQGDKLVLFEVNGWHNLVHILSGLVLLAAYRRWDTARNVAIGFGLVYGVVTIIGLIDGEDVLGLLPVNGADNVLHIALSALGLITGFMSQAQFGQGDVPARR
jgi:hypothetical protein